jgi:hypothetical protein
MRKTILQSSLNDLKNNKFTEIKSDNLDADHKGFDKLLRMFGLKKDIGISTDRERSTIIFYNKKQ